MRDCCQEPQPRRSSEPRAAPSRAAIVTIDFRGIQISACCGDSTPVVERRNASPGSNRVEHDLAQELPKLGLPKLEQSCAKEMLGLMVDSVPTLIRCALASP